jgi:hypothetical protein
MGTRSRDCSEDKVPSAWLGTEGGSRRRDGRCILRKDVPPMEPLCQVYDDGGNVGSAGNEKRNGDIA